MLLLKAAALARGSSRSSLAQWQTLAAALRSLSTTAALQQQEQQQAQSREQMRFDLLIVGAGPAGLSAAIRFKQVG